MTDTSNHIQLLLAGSSAAEDERSCKLAHTHKTILGAPRDGAPFFM